MRFVNTNLPGSEVIKVDNSILPEGPEEDFFLGNQLPKAIWPNVLMVLYAGYNVDLMVNDNILDTDINLLEGDTPVVDLGEYPI